MSVGHVRPDCNCHPGADVAGGEALGHNAGPTRHGPERQPLSIRKKAISALRWRIGAQATSQAITGLCSLVMIRLLLPEDYGLMAGAVLLVGVAQLTSEMGLSSALVQRREIEGPILRQVLGAILLWNAVLVAVLYLTAPLVAAFFGFDGLTTVIRVLSLILVIDLFAAIPTGILSRRIDFRELSLVDMWAAVLSGGAGIAAALAGLGVWALVIVQMTNSAVTTIGVLRAAGATGMPSFDFRGLMPDIRFGAQVTVTAIVNYINRKADLFIVGKLLGQEVLGGFTVAVDLAKFPTRTIMPAITRVMFPVYARMQDHPDKARSAFLQSVAVLSLLMFPTFWGLSAVAEDAVPLLFGDAWGVAADVLRWLCLAMPIRMIDRMLPAVTRGFGREDLTIRNTLVTLGLLVPCLLAGTQWGYQGVAAGWVAAVVLASLINIHHTLPLVGGTWRDVAAAMMPYALAAASMAGAVIAARMGLGGEAGALPRLAVSVVVGGAVYGGLMLAFQRRMVLKTLRMVRE